MRIKEPSAQVGYLLVVVIVITLVLVPLSIASFDLGFVWAVVALVAAVVVAARTFRGRGEPDSRRPWWKMTNTRSTSVALTLLFLFQAMYASVAASQSPNPPLVLVGGVALFIVAAFYLNSAIRMGADSRSA
ncbi:MULTISPECIES: hypothetical protein [Microbacterium]|uniref:DUF2178 domain-containing protein n=1 Tax=Microbacterium algeriense TaxID=2615184 RepID=A0ABQ6V7R1_9MICO|nr:MULTISPECIES: hypothetical protein [Microbacterium]KAB1866271.1 hypothetical protein F6A08_00060 [Microbacterium algeriense]